MLLRIVFLNGRKQDGSPFHCFGESKVGRKKRARTIAEVSYQVVSKNRQLDYIVCLSYEHKESLTLNTFSGLKIY